MSRYHEKPSALDLELIRQKAKAKTTKVETCEIEVEEISLSDIECQQILDRINKVFK